MSTLHDQNRRAWDERVRQRKLHTAPAGDKDFTHPAAVINPCGWLPDGVRGKRVLCLAAGGGKHGPLFAAAGAEVTVVDLSPQMLTLDRQLAAERGLTLRLVETSMDDLSPLATASFDIVIQPVSTCYVPDIAAVYREVARVTAPGCLYISQHKQPVNLQADLTPSLRGYIVSTPYLHSGPLAPIVEESPFREAGAVEFLHRWEEMIGGLCRSGFVVEDVVEPRHGDPQATAGSFAHRCTFLPPYVTLKARRTQQAAPSRAAGLWTP
jgi:SAM-dependent methyltransferase